MQTYFCFSDENGFSQLTMSKRALNAHPFYVRATLIINAGEWRKLNEQINKLRKMYGLPEGVELKWSHLWSLRKLEKDFSVIPKDHDLYPFRRHKYKELVDYVEQCLVVMSKLDEQSIILTFTRNQRNNVAGEKATLRMHLQDQMQRIEMGLQVGNNLGVVFFDPVNPEKDEMLRKVYNNHFKYGDFIEKYKHIKDSLNTENSHHSVGIQLADYIAGCTSALLKSDGNSRYERGVEMFMNSIYPNLRRNEKKGVYGLGIKEVPSDKELRSWIKGLISSKLSE